MGGKLSKYQKFEVEVISRGEIHGADYNPRVISEDARKRLKRMLAKHGLVRLCGTGGPAISFRDISGFHSSISLSAPKTTTCRCPWWTSTSEKRRS